MKNVKKKYFYEKQGWIYMYALKKIFWLNREDEGTPDYLMELLARGDLDCTGTV